MTRSLLPPATAVGLALKLLAVLGIAFYSFRALDERNQAAQRVTHSLRVMELSEAVLSTI